MLAEIRSACNWCIVEYLFQLLREESQLVLQVERSFENDDEGIYSRLELIRASASSTYN